MKVNVNQKEIGNNILNLIKENRLSLDVASKQLKISATKLYSYIEGASVPSLYDLIKICNYFKIEFDSIISYKMIEKR